MKPVCRRIHLSHLLLSSLLAQLLSNGAAQAAADAELDEAAPAMAWVGAQPPTAEFLTARRLHDAGRYGEAAAAWFKVIRQTNPNAGNQRDIAEYELSLALIRLDLPHAALQWLGHAAADKGHVLHLPALGQLGWLAELVEWPAIVPSLAHYSLGEFEQLAKVLQPREAMQLAYWVGRSRYEQGDYVSALQALVRVNESSSHFLEASLLESACHVRQRRSVPALVSLKRAVRALETARLDGSERRRWTDLLNLTQARIYYSSAFQLDADSHVPQISAARLGAAATYYGRLEPASEYYAESTFEMAWLYFLSGDHSRALGKILTLNSPYFSGATGPEVDVLKTIVHFRACDYNAAATVAGRSLQRYQPIRDELLPLARNYNELRPGQLTQAFEQLRRGFATRASTLGPIVQTLAGQRAYQRRVLAVAAVAAELGRLEGLAEGPGAAELGRSLQQALRREHESAALRVDQWLRDALQQRITEIKIQQRNVEWLGGDLEIARRQRLDLVLRSGPLIPREVRVYGILQADEEHQLWPFDGEYWKDELGSYRVVVIDRCSW